MERYTSWESVPDYLATKTQLGKDGLKLAPSQKPVAIKTGGYGPYYLYNKRTAVPKRETTEAQRAAAARNLEKARAALYCVDCGAYGERLDKDGRCRFCRRRHLLHLESRAARASLVALARSDNWLLDTETTGLDQTAEIVQIGIVDAACAQQGIRQFGPAHDAAGGALLTWQLVKTFAD